jgi:hypothetical protein
MSEFIHPALDKEYNKDVYEDIFGTSLDPLSQIINDSDVTQLLKGGKDKGFSPFIIEAPFGAGKTQLLLELFKYFWSHDIPALYTNLNVINKDLEHKLKTTDDISKALVALVEEKLYSMNQNIESKNVNLQTFYMPFYTISTKISSIEQLFEILKIDKNKVIDIIDNKGINRVVLLIDEVENGYEQFSQLLSQYGIDLRSFIEQISETTGILMIMAFGRRSYYDIFLASLKDPSVMRRYKLVQIPLVSPDIYKRKYHDYGNSLWWFTRGRLGWVDHIYKSLPKKLDDALSLVNAFNQNTVFVEKPSGSEVPVLYLSRLHNQLDTYCNNDINCQAAIRYLLLKLQPIKFKDLPEYVRNSINKKIGNLVSVCNKLLDIDVFIEKFIYDLKQQAGFDEHTSNFFKRILYKLLSTLATSDNKICLGSYGIDKLQSYVYGQPPISEVGLFQSLLDLALGMLFDEYGTKYSNEVNIQQFVNNIEKLKSLKEELRKNSTLNFYTLLMDTSISIPPGHDDNYVELSPEIIEILFPFPILDPFIYPKIYDRNTLIDELKKYYESKDFDVEDIIRTSESLLDENKEINNNKFYIIPALESFDSEMCSILKKILEYLRNNDVSISEDSAHPKYIHLIFSIKGNQDEIEKCICQDTLFKFLKSTGFLDITLLNDGLLNDFVRSYFIYKYKVKEEGDISIDEATKQKIDYFKIILSQVARSKIRSDTVRSLNNINDYINDNGCSDLIINVIKRVTSSSPRTKLSTLLLLIYRDSSTNDIITSLENLLGNSSKNIDERISNVDTLPTVYREGVLRGKDHGESCTKLKDLLSQNEIRSLVQAAVDEYKPNSNPLSDDILESIFNKPKLFSYFRALYESRIWINEEEGKYKVTKSDYLRYIYSSLVYYYYLLNYRKSIETYVIEQLGNQTAEELEREIGLIRTLISDIKKEIDEINNNTRIKVINFDIVSPKNEARRLDQELNVLSNIIDFIKNYQRQSPQTADYLNLVFLTTVGSDETELSLQQYGSSIKKLSDELESIKESLHELKGVGKLLKEKSLPSQPYNVDYLKIRYTQVTENNQIKEVNKKLNDLNSKLNELLEETFTIDTLTREIEGHIKDIKSEWGEIYELLGRK